jgi:hypothetical protein
MSDLPMDPSFRWGDDRVSFVLPAAEPSNRLTV